MTQNELRLSVSQRLRDAVAVLLLAVFPAGHILGTRILPITLLTGLLLLGVAFVIRKPTSAVFVGSTTNAATKSLLVCGLLTIGLVLTSALWAPVAKDAVREAAMLLALPFSAWALTMGLSRAGIARPPLAARHRASNLCDHDLARYVPIYRTPFSVLRPCRTLRHQPHHRLVGARRTAFDTGAAGGPNERARALGNRFADRIGDRGR